MDDPGAGRGGLAGGPAPRGLAGRLPPGPGVYRFRDAGGRVLYLGRAVSLRRRVASYWGDLGDRGHLAPMVARIARIEAVACDSAHEAAWLERNLLRARLPPWNRVRSGGQEAEVWVRLSDSARAPGLTVVHEPAAGRAPGTRDFGPYLGGRKIRLAVSGLRRVLPLGYAGDEPLRRGDGPRAPHRDAAGMDGLRPAQRRTRGQAGGRRGVAGSPAGRSRLPAAAHEVKPCLLSSRWRTRGRGLSCHHR